MRERRRSTPRVSAKTGTREGGAAHDAQCVWARFWRSRWSGRQIWTCRRRARLGGEVLVAAQRLLDHYNEPGRRVELWILQPSVDRFPSEDKTLGLVAIRCAR